MILSRSIHVVANGIISFYGWAVLHTHTYFFYPFICRWTFRLFLYLGYCEWCCYEHRGIYISLNYILSGLRPGVGLLDPYSNSIFSFLRNLHAVPHSGYTNSHSLFSTLSSAFVICRLLNDGLSDWCEVIPHCSLDLHFLND